MKITCTTCQAKYTISDDKVRGKTVKIKCKKCGSSIVVNGEGDAGASAGGDGEWSVNVAEGDQRSLTIPQIATLYRDGTINDDTYVWRDGMADWLAISDVPEIRSGLGPSGASQPPDGMDDDMPTRMGQVPAEVMAMSQRNPQVAARPSPAASFGGSPAPAARRSDARPQADLFGGGQSAAPMQEELQTRIAPAADQGGIGARNENSTLFSLSALAGGGGASPGAPARREPPKPSPAEAPTPRA